MIFQQYSYKVREDLNDDDRCRSTTQEFADVVDCWVNSRPYGIWKYWGTLTILDRKLKDIRKTFASWSSMLERKAGCRKFRIVTGAETIAIRSCESLRVYSVNFHVFVAGVVPGTHFQRDWEEQWLRFGGHTACLQEFDWRSVAWYLKNLSPDSRFEIEVKLPVRRQIRPYYVRRNG